MGGEKYSSLELDTTATVGVTAFTGWARLGSSGSGAELSDGSGGGRRARWRAADLVIILSSVRCFYCITFI